MAEIDELRAQIQEQPNQEPRLPRDTTLLSSRSLPKTTVIAAPFLHKICQVTDIFSRHLYLYPSPRNCSGVFPVQRLNAREVVRLRISQARQLAQHAGDQTRRIVSAMSQPANRSSSDARSTDSSLGGATQRIESHGQLAIQNEACENQARVAVPVNSGLTTLARSESR
jgi:hypothetical protein